MIAVGSHIGRALDREFGQADTGTLFVRVRFLIEHGPDAGQCCYWDGWLTEDAIDRTLEGLRAAGWDGISLEALDGLGSGSCRLSVEHERNQTTGRTYPRVAWVNHLPGKLGADRQMPSETLNNLDNRFREFLGPMSLAGRTGEPPKTEPPTRAPNGKGKGAGDDDIPF